jgi:hypothetical protein
MPISDQFPADADREHHSTLIAWHGLMQTLGLPTLAALLYWLGAQGNFLIFHTLAQFFSIIRCSQQSRTGSFSRHGNSSQRRHQGGHL